jgi:hypothetical protein
MRVECERVLRHVWRWQRCVLRANNNLYGRLCARVYNFLRAGAGNLHHELQQWRMVVRLLFGPLVRLGSSDVRLLRADIRRELRARLHDVCAGLHDVCAVLVVLFLRSLFFVRTDGDHATRLHDGLCAELRLQRLRRRFLRQRL